MARFSNPFSQYFSDSGRILPGAQLFFYVNGTTTPQATYADAAFTVVNPNPVICGTNGRVPDIYMPGNLVYSITLTDTNGVQIDQADDITGSDSRVSSSDVIDALAANTDPVVINGSSATINADTTIDGALDVTGTSNLGTLNVDNGGSLPINLRRSGVSGINAGVGMDFELDNSAAQSTPYARTFGVISDPTDGSEDGFYRVQVISGGSVVTAVDIDAGGIVLPNGNGIDFSAAGGDVLDQYIAATTFTATIADAASGGNTRVVDGSNNCRYVRIGDFFYLEMYLTNVNTTGLTPGNNLYIRDLPVTIKTGFTVNAMGSILVNQLTTSAIQITPTAQSGNDYLILTELIAGAVSGTITVADISSGVTDIFLSLSGIAA